MKAGNRIWFVTVAVLTLLVTGCASVPMASSDEDTKAKSFAVPADKADIYVYRNETFGSAIKMPVTLDGKLAGQTGPHTYFMFEVAPGRHEVTSVTENTSTVYVTTEAGKAYFVWQEVKMGMFAAGSKLQEVDEATGRKGVAECKRAQPNF